MESEITDLRGVIQILDLDKILDSSTFSVVPYCSHKTHNYDTLSKLIRQGDRGVDVHFRVSYLIYQLTITLNAYHGGDLSNRHDHFH